jgi:hypothetical protein
MSRCTPADYAIQFEGAGLTAKDVTPELLGEHIEAFGETIDVADAERLASQIRPLMRSASCSCSRGGSAQFCECHD